MDETDGVRSGRGRPMHDLTGRVFGCLIPVEPTKRGSVTYWKCGCTALGIGCVGHTGELKEVAATSIKRLRQRTCGCRKEFNLAQKNEGRNVPSLEREATEHDYAVAHIRQHCPERLVPTLEDLGVPVLDDDTN